jgi:hypothetical protein
MTRKAFGRTLKALAPDFRLGVGWWLYPDENHNKDGRHIDYLQKPAVWRGFDPEAFDHLKAVVEGGDRRVAALQHEHLLPGAVYFDEEVPTKFNAVTRRLKQAQWLDRLSAALARGV